MDCFAQNLVHTALGAAGDALALARGTAAWHRFNSMKRLLAPAFSLFIIAATLACSPTTPPASTPDNAVAARAETAASGTASAPVPAASEAPANGVATPSKAGPAGAQCGGIAGFGCAAGLYCAFPLDAHCGAADQSGVCTRIAEMCTEQYDPVCGCNDKAYPNECYAAREGISVAAKGACAANSPPSAGSANGAPGSSEGRTCGSRGMEPCAAGLYCKFGPDCGGTDAPGKCTKIPQICTRIYRPVCGCDGKTHASDCVAASAGVAVRHEGECKGK